MSQKEMIQILLETFHRFHVSDEEIYYIDAVDAPEKPILVNLRKGKLNRKIVKEFQEKTKIRMEFIKKRSNPYPGMPM